MEKGEIAQKEQFHLSHNVFYAICLAKTFNSHISVVVCSFFEFVRSQNGVLGNGLNIVVI